MNEVFLIGKIITKIEFEFIIDSKYISISNFKIKTTDKQTIAIIGYDSLADFTYSKLKMNDDIFVYGKLRQNKIIVNNIIKL